MRKQGEEHNVKANQSTTRSKTVRTSEQVSVEHTLSRLINQVGGDDQGDKTVENQRKAPQHEVTLLDPDEHQGRKLYYGVFIHVLLAGVLLSFQASASVTQTALQFESQNQSLWNTGDAGIFRFSETLAKGSWDLGGHIGGVKSTWIGKYGAELSAHTSGSFGLGLDAVLNAGSVNASVPFNVSLQLPDTRTLRPGEAFTVGSTDSLGLNASLTSTSPTGSLRLFGDLTAKADVAGRVCVVGCASGSVTLLNASVRKDLFSLGTNDLKFAYNGAAGSVQGQFPTLNLNGTVSGGNSIRAAGEANVLSASVDIASLLGLAAGLPPLSGSINLGIGKLDYNLIKTALNAALDVTQELTLVPRLMVDLALSTGEHRVFAAGNSQTLIMPASGETLSLTPTYFIQAMLENKTGILGKADLDLSALSVGLSKVGRIGPLFHKDIGLGSLSATLLDKRFVLTGFNTILGSTSSLEPVPEPITMVLLGSGLIAIGLVRRRVSPSKWAITNR